MNDKEFKERTEDAEQAAQQLCDSYYECLDKKRHQIHRMYAESSILIYDGKRLKSQDEIKKQLNEGDESNHRIETLDVQPVDDSMTDGKSSFLISAAGSVRFGTKSAIQKVFNHHFVVAKVDGHLKIISQTVRHFSEIERRR
ncbi:unnamed protein product [Oikopleura dioica]|uniref:NTF2-related export protein n=1 Tax=Oikopleura dioica TaxID=34765 RepID=E4WWJ7_OIKDI|nr:unnamed protein product [Oikopleura dioica]